MHVPKHRILTYPRSRLATMDVGRIGRRKHHVAALLEVDVTCARERIRRILKAGGCAGIVSWTVYCAARAIKAHPGIAAVNSRGLRQVVFDDVDIAIPLEREIGGIKVPLTTLLRKAQSRTVAEIHNALTADRTRGVAGTGDYVLSERKIRRFERIFFSMPALLRVLVWHVLLRNPFTLKRNMGTAMVTNAGLSGRSSGWIFPKSIHNLAFAIGTITKKPRVLHGEILPRDVMNLTVLFDHDVVDGVPAARFTDTLVKLMEGAEGLDEMPGI